MLLIFNVKKKCILYELSNSSSKTKKDLKEKDELLFIIFESPYDPMQRENLL
ncbi:hypothetical protein [Leptospira stimsonii]|uniref:hypothetical protein n=1 Tax=Leptospira stimsonii TaxID=2202203 RepID=UPI0013148134|nr:hypothetical protein [Leptospira stimsonii]